MSDGFDIEEKVAAIREEIDRHDEDDPWEHVCVSDDLMNKILVSRAIYKAELEQQDPPYLALVELNGNLVAESDAFHASATNALRLEAKLRDDIRAVIADLDAKTAVHKDAHDNGLKNWGSYVAFSMAADMIRKALGDDQ